MKALVFGIAPQGFTPPPDANDARAPNLAVTPVALQEIPDARPLRPDWVVTRPCSPGSAAPTRSRSCSTSATATATTP